MGTSWSHRKNDGKLMNEMGHTIIDDNGFGVIPTKIERFVTSLL